MDPRQRQRALVLLHTSRPDDAILCRDVESHCHARATNARDYDERVRHAAFNLHSNPDVGIEVVSESDDVLAADTLVGRIQEQTRHRQERFHAMLQDKYDALNDQRFQAIVVCRRCGSDEVTWDEKQTRSADEGATIFCVCITCKNRWVMRQ